MVEHLAVNQVVEGSSPSSSASEWVRVPGRGSVGRFESCKRRTAIQRGLVA